MTVAVVDRAGRPAPFARVSVRRADGQGSVDLVAAANGRVELFPDLDAVRPGGIVEVTGPGGARASARLGAIGRITTVEIDEAARPVAALDLLLVVDTTGSMSDELRFLQAELVGIVSKVARANPGVDLRVGLEVYRDLGDAYVVRTSPFTGDVAAVQDLLRLQRATGGGDQPEAVDLALAAAYHFDWRRDAAKVAVFVADAPPHGDKAGLAWRAVEASRARGIQFVPVAASGVERHAQYLMRTMAAVTGSRYLFLTDDSGVGNAHAEPQVDCYRVTALDGLLVRVVSGLVAGRRIEAEPDEVIRTVGEYDGGRCLAPQTVSQ